MTQSKDSPQHSKAGSAPSRVERLATSVGPYKTLFEFVLVATALAYGTIFVVRTWPYPSASLEVGVAERVRDTAGPDRVVLAAKFTVGDAANLQVHSLTASCKVLSSAQACDVDCDSAQDDISSGPLPRADTISWGCLATVPASTCVEIKIEVGANATGVMFGSSRWRSSVVSCASTR